MRSSRWSASSPGISRTTPQTIALLSAAFALPYAFIQPILGPIGDALGKERVMKVGLRSLFLALAGSFFAPDAATLFILRIIAGRCRRRRGAAVARADRRPGARWRSARWP